MKSSSNFLIALCFGLLIAGAFAHTAGAATYSFRASNAAVHIGQEVAVDLIIDAEGQSLNTLSGTLRIPSNLAFVDSDDSASVVGLWVDQPTYNSAQGTFTFSGIIPGGFSGLIAPFETNGPKTGAVVTRLLFKGREAGSGTLSFTQASAYLNDAVGTEALMSTSLLSIVVDGLIIGDTFEGENDTIPPLPFTPVLERDILLYDGKWVVIFNTKDKESGMDHYEIKEGEHEWVVAESPYILTDQKVRGDIVVKAVDRAGNAQYATIPGLSLIAPWQMVLIGLAVLFILLYLVLKKRKKQDEVKAAPVHAILPK